MTTKENTKNIGIGFIFIAWGIFFGLVTYFFHGWYSAKENPNQNVASTVRADGSSQIVLKRNSQSHYVVSGKINGVAVTFLLDTGATWVVIPEGIAKKLKVRLGAQSRASTAAGEVAVYDTMLDSIEIGNLLLKNIKASVNPSQSDDLVLLGMSALKHLKLEQQGDDLVLQLPGR